MLSKARIAKPHFELLFVGSNTGIRVSHHLTDCSVPVSPISRIFHTVSKPNTRWDLRPDPRSILLSYVRHEAFAPLPCQQESYPSRTCLRVRDRIACFRSHEQGRQTNIYMMFAAPIRRLFPPKMCRFRLKTEQGRCGNKWRWLILMA